MKRLLVANRGEIACRVMSSAKALGIETVAVHSEADADARFVRLADHKVCIGPGPAAESYLVIEKIIEAALKTKADAVHPGYGFLSERARFADAVLKAGLKWLGPSPQVIDLMGNKIAAKKAAEKAGVPTLPWAVLADGWGAPELKSSAKAVGYPLLLKAAAGGGGRGMRIVGSEKEILEKAESAAREAEGAFGSGEIFLERYCLGARHIEVQVLGDKHGKVAALGERDCSVQRRHQKVIEEAPAPNLSAETRAKLRGAAVDLSASVGYESAGTCEFLVDSNEEVYFLEMNTRLQVEHPVTEWVFGVDLVSAQIAIAEGEALSEIIPHVDDLAARGHAIEARAYAEDPARNFMPQPGELTDVRWPTGPFVRVDHGYESGSTVPVFYDAMLAKIIAWGMTREQARANLLNALEDTAIEGVRWNGEYLRAILKHEDFIRGRATTQLLGEKFAGWQPSKKAPSKTKAPAPKATERSPWKAFALEEAGRGGSSYARAGNAESGGAESAEVSGPLRSEYPGKVLKVLVKAGEVVSDGQALVVCESMKMEFTYSAPAKAKVVRVAVSENMLIAAGAVLIEWES